MSVVPGHDGDIAMRPTLRSRDQVFGQLLILLMSTRGGCFIQLNSGELISMSQSIVVLCTKNVLDMKVQVVDHARKQLII